MLRRCRRLRRCARAHCFTSATGSGRPGAVASCPFEPSDAHLPRRLHAPGRDPLRAVWAARRKSDRSPFRRRRHLPVGFPGGRLHAKSAAVTATTGSWRCAASPAWILTHGWSWKAGRLPGGDTRSRTLPRRRMPDRRSVPCGAASYRRRIGAGASAWAERGRRSARRPDGATSREISARTAGASTTCRAGGPTHKPGSIRRRMNGGSAARGRRGRRDGGVHGNDPASGIAAARAMPKSVSSRGLRFGLPSADRQQPAVQRQERSDVIDTSLRASFAVPRALRD